MANTSSYFRPKTEKAGNVERMRKAVKFIGGEEEFVKIAEKYGVKRKYDEKKGHLVLNKLRKLASRLPGIEQLTEDYSKKFLKWEWAEECLGTPAPEPPVEVKVFE